MSASNESRTHIAFKKIAIDILKERGFNLGEIHEEYNVEYKVNGQIKYTIDVAGIKGDHKVAMECGSVQITKLLNLRKIFDEVIVIDVDKVVEMYEYWKTKCYTEVVKLREDNQRLKEHGQWVVDDANKRIGPYEEKVEKLETELHKIKDQLKKLQEVIAKAWEQTRGQFSE